MFNQVRGVNQYQQVEIETSVSGASPHSLILLLMEGSLVAINMARARMAEGDVPAKGEAVSKAIALIDEGLRASLDMNAGGEIAQNLDALYEYMCHQLLVANIKNDINRLEEVARLMGEIRDAWKAIGEQAVSSEFRPAPSSPPQPEAPPRSYGAA
ncbi:MAG: flagellar export chaperone FliS [Azonexus sp.]|nr:flagellar export chaperone FliS [Azonexus sp.]MCK6411282.1 flagellar export chaperone FliS [Azonexus sp.]